MLSAPPFFFLPFFCPRGVSSVVLAGLLCLDHGAIPALYHCILNGNSTVLDQFTFISGIHACTLSFPATPSTKKIPLHDKGTTCHSLDDIASSQLESTGGKQMKGNSVRRLPTSRLPTPRTKAPRRPERFIHDFHHLQHLLVLPLFTHDLYTHRDARHRHRVVHWRRTHVHLFLEDRGGARRTWDKVRRERVLLGVDARHRDDTHR